jgi:hypothetical protein
MSIQVKPVEQLSVNSREARKMLGVSAGTLYNLRKSGAIVAVPLNPKAKSPTWLYLVSSLKQHLGIDK